MPSITQKMVCFLFRFLFSSKSPPPPPLSARSSPHDSVESRRRSSPAAASTPPGKEGPRAVERAGAAADAAPCFCPTAQPAWMRCADGPGSSASNLLARSRLPGARSSAPPGLRSFASQDWRGRGPTPPPRTLASCLYPLPHAFSSLASLPISASSPNDNMLFLVTPSATLLGLRPALRGTSFCGRTWVLRSPTCSGH